MELEFLKKLFENDEISQVFDHFEIINFKEFDLARLYAKYTSLNTSSNTILLPSNFINPTFKPISYKLNDKVKTDEFVNLLVEGKYEKVDQVFDRMQFSQKGDVFIIYSSIGEYVFKVEFFGDVIEKISLVDNISFRFIKELKNFVLLNIKPEELDFDPEIYGNYDTINSRFIIYTKSSQSASGLETKSIPLFHKNEKVFQQFTQKYSDYQFCYSGHNWELLPQGFKTFDVGIGKTINLELLNLDLILDKGFIVPDKKIYLLTDKEILSTLNLTKSKSKLSSKFKKLFDQEVNIGDYVVHEAHGVGIYCGIETKIVLGEVRDYAIVEYLGNDKLLIPLEQLDRLSKYLSADGGEPRLTKLGTVEWETIKRRLKKSVEDIAGELLEIYAKKNMQKGIKFEEDNAEQLKFESEFKYELTEDQRKTVSEVKDDMESVKPMDRLVIGDVGFGKTEIAIRAAFKAVQSGKQVLVLAPTTVLVTQLYEVFYKRLTSFGIRVSRVSRFDGTKKNKENIDKANQGKTDILIGTHRLLSKDVELKNLGLLIIDEEQRFGVKQKEKIRKLRTNIDLLSMSATPIPRTLQMALTGIKDISIIATPPPGRVPVHTEIIFEEDIPEKIKEEYKRHGQVFLVHNKVQDIETYIQNIKAELPEQIKVTYGHGQMTGDKLEKIMMEFQEKKYDVLIATTIIENGLDIPNVNTIIIDDAHNFGLSQLYQLRGRVGRSSTQSYCYLIVPKTKDFINLHKNPTKELQNLHKLLEENKIDDKWITKDSVYRIEALLENQELGAGFKIASRDLEIRGSGNILGSQQSGHINAVGFEMFVRLLEQEIDRIRKMPAENKEESIVIDQVS